MADYVDSVILVEDEDELVNELANSLFDDDDGYSLNNIVPISDQTDTAIMRSSWGSYSDLCDGCTTILSHHIDGIRTVIISFQTKTEPPVEAIRQLSKKFPSLRLNMELQYITSSNEGVKGYVFRNGNVNKIKEK